MKKTNYKKIGGVISHLVVSILFLSSLFSVAEAITIEHYEAYRPDLNPALFTSVIDNPYFSLPIGMKMVYEAQTDEGLERIEILVPGWTRMIEGIETLVFWDRVYLNGELIEDTRDYLAQHKETGDVWYFGEHVDNYEKGVISDHDGAWLTGVDGALPGIWALGNPRVGDEFRNEFYRGKAEDESRITSITATVETPLGTFANCVESLDGSPLFDDKAYTYYCKQVSNTALEVDLPHSEMPNEQRVILVERSETGALESDGSMMSVPVAYAQEGVVLKGADTDPTTQTETEGAEGNSGGARTVWLILAILVVGGVAYTFTKKR